MVLPLGRLGAMIGEPDEPDSLLGVVDYAATFVEFVPAIVMGILGGLAVGQIAGQLTSGSAPAAAGLFQRAASALASAASGLSPFQGVGRGPAVPQSLSSVTGQAPGAGSAASATDRAARAAAAAAAGGRPLSPRQQLRANAAAVAAAAAAGGGSAGPSVVLRAPVAARNSFNAVLKAHKDVATGRISEQRFEQILRHQQSRIETLGTQDSKRVLDALNPRTRAQRFYDSAKSSGSQTGGRPVGPGPQPT